MNSSALHADNTELLLDIVYGLHGGDVGYPYRNLPFSRGDDGSLRLSPYLMTELNKQKNKNLIRWAYQNIESLFW